MKMFATDYTVPVFCGVCNADQQNKTIACFYSDTEGYYVELFVCQNCLDAIQEEVKTYAYKNKSITR